MRRDFTTKTRRHEGAVREIGAAGSFMPDGYQWIAPSGDTRQRTIGDGVSGYAALGMDLDRFDYVFAYPWPGEDLMMQDIVRRCGGTRTRLLQYGPEGVQIFPSS